jgi:hypothetical protein
VPSDRASPSRGDARPARLPDVAQRDRKQHQRDEPDAPVDDQQNAGGEQRRERAGKNGVEGGAQGLDGIVEARRQNGDAAAGVDVGQLPGRHATQPLDDGDAHRLRALPEQLADDAGCRDRCNDLQDDGNGQRENGCAQLPVGRRPVQLVVERVGDRPDRDRSEERGDDGQHGRCA